MLRKNGPAKTLVIGAGIAGIKAALELAELGNKVYLCDRKPYIGGTLTQLDKWFPDNHCGMCKVLPVFDRDRSSQYCLRQGLVHNKIELLPLTEVQGVEGEAGDFSVTLNLKSPWVREDLCTGCGLCEQVCPVEVDSEFNQGLEQHKAVYLSHPLALHKIYTIDRESCTKCGTCVDKCPTGAIDLSIPDETREIRVGAIILSTGFEEFDPLPATQYGYKRYPNLITSIELERLLSNTGPSQGSLIRPSDGQAPRSVAFVQCVGSRDMQRDYCSSACCMYAIKEAMMIKKAAPDTDIHIFFMDIRDFGKGYHRYYQQARDELGIKFIRCRIPTVKQDFRTKDLLITAKGQHDEPITDRFDLVVLSVGQAPSQHFRETSQILGLACNKWGFCQTRELSLVDTTKEGIYACGSASGPKDIADTLIGATAVANRASALIAPVKAPPTEPPPMSEEEPKVAVIICNCNEQISQVVDTKGLIDYSQGLSDVVHVEEIAHLCQQEALKEAVTKVKKVGANRLILVACSVLRCYELAEGTPVELVNIREELAWVHRDSNKAATEKGKALIAMALEKIKGRQNLPLHADSVTPRALVLGGGLAGLVATNSIAERGFEVELVEKSSVIGGNTRHVHSLLEGGNPQEYLQRLVEKVEANSLIHLRMETEAVKVTGYAGNFRCTLRDKTDEPYDIEAGTIVVATGAEEFQPTEYLYGQTEQVITQRELEERLSSRHIDPKDLKSVVMIQCVGSREDIRPYCSRICCSQALKNALTLKRQNPEIEVIIIYRDLMSYGFKEEYYTTARQEGVLFVRYDPERKPQVTFDGNQLKLQAIEPALGGSIVLNPDLVILSPAIVPCGSNADLAQVLDVELTMDGFFEETEVKFLPVDTLRAGIFVCGLAHSPRDMPETIVQAQAAAQRATQLLARGQLTAGRMISEVNERWCSGCELCVRICPYDARVKDPQRGVVVVREALCQGCGACVVACPNGASSLKELKDKQIFSILDAAI